MTLETTFQKLDQNNYKTLQKAIEDIDNLENTSALYLYLLKYYDVTVFYKINSNSIYFICKLEKDLIIDNILIQDYYAIKPIIKSDQNYTTIFSDFVKIFKTLTNKDSLFIDRMLEINFESLPKFNILYTWEIAYLYEVEQLKYFAGKKMQKKRNLLNFFNKNYLDKTTIKKYDSKYNKDILDFCKQHIQKYSDVFREHEYLAIEELITIASNENNISGTIIYYESNIVGVTLGYTHNLYYEIFLEKANKDFKGSYQFLLSNNLILNDINTKYIDRQDGESISGLIDSKRSYKPIKIISGNLLEINVNDN
ncbi:MAG: phosphatidylglycerol lysyltransferase domain-containing protein [Malacoplasma sp.]